MPTGLKLIPLAIGGLATLAVVVFVAMFVLRAWWGTPMQVFGFGEPPEQPISFPHTQHVDIDGINCVFCHRNVMIDDEASVPAVEQCMFCHETIQGENAPPEISKVVAHFTENKPIDWIKIHRLPDHVQFSHEPHIRFLTQVHGIPPEQACSTCHGEVEHMVEVEQVRPLKMRDCVDCHRKNLESTENKDITDCTTCHY